MCPLLRPRQGRLQLRRLPRGLRRGVLLGLLHRWGGCGLALGRLLALLSFVLGVRDLRLRLLLRRVRWRFKTMVNEPLPAGGRRPLGPRGLWRLRGRLLPGLAHELLKVLLHGVGPGLHLPRAEDLEQPLASLQLVGPLVWVQVDIEEVRGALTENHVRKHHHFDAALLDDRATPGEPVLAAAVVPRIDGCTGLQGLGQLSGVVPGPELLLGRQLSHQ
mmetsp:Transcript_105735/g.309278  ORF Transcript_105735/g.309278 Transcript_105735/m.309278 type:complete len:218 (-) Transcript_105735:382-1035(-)